MSNKWLNSPKSILNDFIFTLFPEKCAICDSTLIRGEEICCVHCNFDLPRINNDTTENKTTELFYGRFPFELASSFMYYRKNGPYSELLHLLKYSGREDIGLWLGKIYANQLRKSNFFSGIDALLPVPIHKKRLKKRGYNQSEVICEGMSEISTLPIIHGLNRVHHSKSQITNNRETRWQNMQNSFEVSLETLNQFNHVLLVDDVITTGATIDACVSPILEQYNCKVSICSIGLAIG